MIPTRWHGVIDHASASLMGVLAVRRAFGLAGALHAGSALATDHEAGPHGRRTTRQHLALEAVGAGCLCAAGLLLRRQPPAARLLLLGAGLAELAVVATSSPRSDSGPGYPPLDTLKPVAPDIWIVDSAMSGLLSRVLPVRMTVIRLSTGEVLLHSPTRFSPALRRQIEELGPIRHLVAPDIAHWLFLRPWQLACPDAVTWAAPGLRERGQVRRSFVRIDHELGAHAPGAWGDGITLVMVRGGFGFHEAALFHQPSRTLVLTDLVLNLERRKLPALLRPIARAFGSLAPDGMPPPYLRATIRLRGRAPRDAAARLLDLRPDRVLFAHGKWFAEDATAALRRSLRWLLR
jgi:hypothetical protein